MKKSNLILGIETSCDETSAAVYDQEKGIRSNVIFSQADMHKHYGGVVPEIASRTQLQKIAPIVQEALDQADVTLDDITHIAVTHKPGLPGSLLVGLCFAKALAWAKNKKLIGVNHLEGHAFSPFLENTIPFPHLCLTASGGHTSLYLIKDFGDYEVLGETMDDAAGEAFDKISKVLGLPYPGGPEIEKRAKFVHFQDFFKYPRQKGNTLDFSFSGLKTAVLYDLVKRDAYNLKTKTLLDTSEDLKDKVASSLLVCIGDIFVKKITQALKEHPEVKAVTFVGGVACNKYLRERLKKVCDAYNVPLYFPSPQYCTDNAGMIAFVGNYKAQRDEIDTLGLDIF